MEIAGTHEGVCSPGGWLVVCSPEWGVGEKVAKALLRPGVAGGLGH